MHEIVDSTLDRRVFATVDASTRRWQVKIADDYHNQPWNASNCSGVLIFKRPPALYT